MDVWSTTTTLDQSPQENNSNGNEPKNGEVNSPNLQNEHSKAHQEACDLDDGKNASFVEQIREFGLNTTHHGVRYLWNRDASILRR